MPAQYQSQIIAREQIAKDTWEVALERPKEFRFSAGQYIWVVLPELSFEDPKGDRRAFSITCAPDDESKLTVQFRDTGSGYKKTILNSKEKLKVNILGPFGSSYIPTPEQTKIVMIAGGVGVAPFLSILRSPDLIKEGRLTLIYTNSEEASASHVNELKDISAKYKIPFLNKIGLFVEADLPKDIDSTNSYFFICGPKAFVDAVYKVLYAKGVPFEHMHFEQHYPEPEGNLTEQDFVQKPGQRNIMLQAVHDSKNHVIVTDANGQIIFANKTAERNTGYRFSEMRGNTPRIWGGLMPLEFYHTFWHQKHEASGFEGQLTNRRKNGEIYHVIAHISPIFSDKNIVIGYIGTEEDITKMLELEERLAQEKQRDEALLLSLGEGVVAQDKNSKVIFINKSALGMVGYSEKEVIGQSFVNIVNAESPDGRLLEESERPLSKAAQTKQPIKASLIYIRKDGTKFESDIVITPIYMGAEYFGDIQVFSDVTKEKEAQVKIAQNALQLEKMNQFMIGRELKMIELKKEISRLKGEK